MSKTVKSGGETGLDFGAAEEPCGFSRAATHHEESRERAIPRLFFREAGGKGRQTGICNIPSLSEIAEERRSREKKPRDEWRWVYEQFKIKNGERDGTRTRNIHRDRVAL